MPGRNEPSAFADFAKKSRTPSRTCSGDGFEVSPALAADAIRRATRRTILVFMPPGYAPPDVDASVNRAHIPDTKAIIASARHPRSLTMRMLLALSLLA